MFTNLANYGAPLCSEFLGDHWDLLYPGLSTATGIATVVQWDALKPAAVARMGRNCRWTTHLDPKISDILRDLPNHRHGGNSHEFQPGLTANPDFADCRAKKSGSACRWQAKFSIFLRFRTKTPELFTLTQPRRIAAAIIIFAAPTAFSSAAWSGSWSRSVLEFQPDLLRLEGNKCEITTGLDFEKPLQDDGNFHEENDEKFRDTLWCFPSFWGPDTIGCWWESCHDRRLPRLWVCPEMGHGDFFSI